MESWEFGHAVRRWRDRAAPETAGVPAGGRRRAAGLRREELAGLAGISVDYLTRLEQGRATSPSSQVVEALARALRLSDIERELLFRLAGQAAPGHDVVPARITPSVQRLLDRLSHTPVAVHDAAWNLIVANQPYDALMGETRSWRGIERNGVWRNLVGPGNRTVHTPEEQARFESLLVADLWESGQVDSPQDQSRHKIIDHPDVGLIALDCDTLIVAGDDLRITVYTAEPGTQDAERLALAIVLGTQALID